MARNIWTGSISFGLVNVPVGLQTAVEEKTVRFKQVSSKTGALVKQKRVDADTGVEVAYEDIVKGFELSPKRYVIVDPDELVALEPAKTKRIDIEEFTDSRGIDALAYGHNYWVAPAVGGEKAFAMLAEAMLRADKVGVGRLVMRSKEYAVVLQAVRGGMLCTTLNYADEIRPGTPWDPSEVSEAELTQAGLLIDAISVEPFEHEKYRDGFRDKVVDMIERKAAGMPAPEPEEDEAKPPVASLMDALNASLAQVMADEPRGTITSVPIPEEVEAE